MSAHAPIHEIGERHMLPEGTTFNDVTETVARITETKAPRGWWILFFPSLGLLGRAPHRRPRSRAGDAGGAAAWLETLRILLHCS